MSANLRVYDSIVQILALLFYGMSSCASILIPRLLKFLDALVSLKPILFSDFMFWMMGLNVVSKLYR